MAASSVVYAGAAMLALAGWRPAFGLTGGPSCSHSTDTPGRPRRCWRAPASGRTRHHAGRTPSSPSARSGLARKAPGRSPREAWPHRSPHGLSEQPRLSFGWGAFARQASRHPRSSGATFRRPRSGHGGQRRRDVARIRPLALANPPLAGGG